VLVNDIIINKDNMKRIYLAWKLSYGQRPIIDNKIRFNLKYCSSGNSISDDSSHVTVTIQHIATV